MCLKYIKVKNKVNVNGISYAYIPCGKCADCRKKEQDAWRFRLRLQFNDLIQRGYNVGVITLTYCDTYLPKIPEVCFKRSEQVKDINCFDKKGVQAWIKSIKNYCQYHYKYVNDKSLVYFIASEYGSLTHRPHYHAIIAWPGDGKCDYKTMHSLCKHFWTYGMVGPDKCEGDRNCLPFKMQGDPTAALTYVSKYVSKDIDYVDEIGDTEFYSNVRDYEEGTLERTYASLYRNCVPFHIQSVSFGYEPIKRMSDEEKFDVIKNGMGFVGDDKLYQVPMYIKNKIFYNNYYVVDEETGKRMVRREASEFFEKNHQEIFEKKAEFYDKYVRQVNKGFMEQSGIDSELVNKLSYSLEVMNERVKSVYEDQLDYDYNMGKMYLAYNAVQSDRCFDIPLCEQWMLRYRRPDYIQEDYERENWPLVDGYKMSYLRDLWNLVNMIYSYIGVVHLQDRENEDRLRKKLISFYSNLK